MPSVPPSSPSQSQASSETQEIVQSSLAPSYPSKYSPQTLLIWGFVWGIGCGVSMCLAWLEYQSVHQSPPLNQGESLSLSHHRMQPKSPKSLSSQPLSPSHPTFHCRDFEAPLRSFPSSSSKERQTHRISTLQNQTQWIGKRVHVHGRVMSIYPRIMGVNWVRLCDDKQDHALVVTTQDPLSVGSEVILEGVLNSNIQIGQIYYFDRLLQSANLVKTHPAFKSLPSIRSSKPKVAL